MNVRIIEGVPPLAEVCEGCIDVPPSHLVEVYPEMVEPRLLCLCENCLEGFEVLED